MIRRKMLKALCNVAAVLVSFFVTTFAWATCVIDDAGRQACMPEPAARVVSLSPHATELVAWLVGEQALVGVDTSSDFPNSASTLPKVADAQQLNLEELLQLKPDLVVAWASSLPAHALAWLEAHGVVVFVSEPKGVAGVASNMRGLGMLLGVAPVELEQRVERWLAGFPKVGLAEQPVRVFYQVWEKPLITLGGEHTLSDLINRCGGINIFADLKLLGPTIDTEAVVTRNPELIITSGPFERGKAALSHWNTWETISAVKHQQLRVLPPDILVRPGPRLLEGTVALCEAIDSAANIARGKANGVSQQQVRGVN